MNMEPGGSRYTDAPFNRGNYKFKYTPDEEAHIVQFAKGWIPTKGLFSGLVGGGVTYGLIQKGIVGTNNRVFKIGGGAFLAFTAARIFATRGLQRDLRERYPDGYAAQMYYLRQNSEAFAEFVSFARNNKHLGINPTRPDRFPSMPSNNQPAPIATDVPGTHTPPAGLDDRFRPQMDGILQAKRPEDEDIKRDQRGSYAMWRSQKSPQSPEQPRPPLVSGLSDSYQPPQYDTYQNPSDNERPKQPIRQDPPLPKKPVKRNQYGDIIED